MKSITGTVIMGVLVFSISCSKRLAPAPSPPSVTETPVDVRIDVNNVVRLLTGNEVGINVNYLMDDNIIAGNSYMKTAQGIKQMGVKLMRYPGGEKSDNYYFSSSPYAAAAPKAAYCSFPSSDTRFFNGDFSAKNAVVDFDEFMVMCIEAQAQPLVVVAYDAIYAQGTCGPKPTKAQMIENAKQWVRYANITKNHNVKLWMIGNESWLAASYNGFTTPAQYALDIVEFADAMRSVDPTIKIIANGRSDWWSTLLLSPAVAKIDYLAVSNYLPSAISSYDKFRLNSSSLNGETDQAIAALDLVSNADKARIGVIESEFNSIDFTAGGWASINNLGHALCSFQMQADGLLKSKLFSACFWNTRWIENTTKPQNLFDALQENGNLNANGIGLSILGNNLLTAMVSSTAGSGIKSYASYNNANKNVRVFLLNKETVSKKVRINFANYLSTFSYDKWEFKGNSFEDMFPTWAAAATNQAGTATLEMTLPATSVTMLACK
jgi:hypothetical protein